MTDITPLIKAGSHVIQGYGAGSVRISGTTYTTSVCVTVDSVTPWSGGISDIAFGAPEDQVELVLIGLASAANAPLAPDLRTALRAKGWAVEIMDIGAACRTYNVLMADGRKVGVALQIAPPPSAI